MSDKMRDMCIALEAAHIAMRTVTTKASKTYGEIATEAIDIVDQSSAKGNLGFLYYAWTNDSSSSESTSTIDKQLKFGL